MPRDETPLRERYGQSEHGNFLVVDTIGTPHPYMITAKHVAVAADQHGGMLGVAAIEDAERQGACCGICKGKLRYAQHETALLVECKAELKGSDGKVDPELHAYLLKIKDKAESDNYAGFAFKRAS